MCSLRIIPFLVATIGCLCLRVAAAPQSDVEQAGAYPEQVTQLLETVAAGDNIKGDQSKYVPVLVWIVDNAGQQKSELAMRALEQIKPKSDAAAAAFCRRLSDERHASRALAVNALVAMGQESVAPLKKLLESSTGKTRAAAAEGLRRLSKLDLETLQELASDPDPRVRIVVVQGFAAMGRPGVEPLASYLADPELSVAAEAAKGLGTNRADSAVSVPKLIQALSREGLGWAAALALQDYGIDANRAVPAIINSYPLGNSERFGWEDAAEVALQHIGPPDVRDISQTCENLKSDNEEVRILTAQSLTLLGIKGRPAADALELATLDTLEWYLKLDQQFTEKPDDVNDNSGRVVFAAEYLAAAVWHVTHDADRFVELMTKIINKTDFQVTFSDPLPWHEFSVDDCRSLKPLLDSTNPNLQASALLAISEIGTNAEILKGEVLRIARGNNNDDLLENAFGALAAIGPGVADEAAPILMAKWRQEAISIETFATTVGALEIRSREFQIVLEQGLAGRERLGAQASADAIWDISDDHEQSARLIIHSARKSGMTNRDVIEVFQRQPAAADVVVPYLMTQMRSGDFWLRQEATDLLGSYGKDGMPAVSRLKTATKDKRIEMRLAAAKSLLQIIGNTSYLEKELQAVKTAPQRGDVYDAIVSIRKLRHDGAPYVDFVIQALPKLDPIWVDDAVGALSAVGTPEAIAALQQASHSTDWAIRSQSTAALKNLQITKPSEGK